MKYRMLVVLLALGLILGLTACGSQTAPASADQTAASAPAEDAAAPAEEPAEEPAEASAEEPAEEPAEASAEASPEEPAETSAEEPAEEPAEASAEASPEEPAETSAGEPAEEAPEAGKPVTVTFSDGQTFEATVGEDFVFFFQCDAPGDMGQPAEGEEGAGITTSEGTVTYSNVGLGGPYSYPTSEKVTISGFTGDFEVTICEEATFMDATYTIYTDPEEIDAAIAFAEEMEAQRAANPMP